MATITSNENWINFINKFKSLPELWDKKCDSYKNNTKKKAAYEKLIKEYKNIDKYATLEIVKKRIKNMLFTYKRELKKKIVSENNGAEYKPNLWYFSHFEFLNEFEMPEKEICTVSSDVENFSVDTCNSDGFEVFEEVVCHDYIPEEKSIKRPKREELHIKGTPEHEVNTSSLEKKIRQNRNSRGVEEFEDVEDVEYHDYISNEKSHKRPKRVEPRLKETSEHEVSTNANSVENEFTAFGTSVSFQLQKLPEEDAYQLMAEIQNLITQRKFQNLRSQRSLSVYSNESL